jgi:hypothetical protein
MAYGTQGVEPPDLKSHRVSELVSHIYSRTQKYKLRLIKVLPMCVMSWQRYQKFFTFELLAASSSSVEVGLGGYEMQEWPMGI